ncbi:isopentenyl-diphosphate Delta-isomerase [Actinoplanes utahensis]|uniref:isopentenyl-diphosphate Delta-isomerase n=1 Tax=Actinoplanes utahensis TaxID=1869 RepID=UPI0007C77113|nr:isopentenyl-diphosphate Delta-isomerase [Actinoplanes utahensis]GIF30822.1 hypothetical protein Aut01nite_38080 [Actinoplanes utahensis]
MTTPSRESDLVELVDDQGGSTGTASVRDAHEAPGMLHRAFSVFLRDPSGRLLLQQRAAVKTRFPLRWGNTCCGHPVPGEDITVSAGRRVAEELGFTPEAPLREVGVHVYFATDPVTGRVEREYDHVLLGEVAGGITFRPDPGEVARLRWVSIEDLRQELAATPESYAPWLDGVTERLATHLDATPSSPSSPSAPLPSPPSSPSAPPSSSPSSPSAPLSSSPSPSSSSAEGTGGR